MTARGTSSDPPPSWHRRAAILAIAVMMLVLIYFGAGLLFNRTNPQRQGHYFPVPSAVSPERSPDPR